MIPYWLLFLIPAYLALTRPKAQWDIQLALIIWISLSIFIGFRHDIGGDWHVYEKIFSLHTDIPFSEVNYGHGDSLFYIINWICSELELNVYAVNLICSSIFSGGLVVLCKRTARPWLALTVSIPYLIIVVGMGYTRQAVAIGFLLFGYEFLAKGKVINFLIASSLAALFHQTSLVVLPLALPYISGKSRVNNILKTLILVMASAALIRFLLFDKLDFFIHGYFHEIYIAKQAQGAEIRILLNLIPSIIFLFFKKQLNFKENELKVWTWISVFCCLCGVAIFVSASKTVVDRLALYALPIQPYVASKIPDFKILKLNPRLLNFSVIVFAFTVQFVWLNFGRFSSHWLPYQNMLLL